MVRSADRSPLCDRGGLAVEPDPHHRAVEDQADDRFRGERAGIPGIPIGFHLSPHPAHGIFADRAAKHRGERPTHPTCVGAGQIGAGNKRIGLLGVLLVVLGVRQDGQKVLLAVKNMGAETSQAWRAVLDDLVKRELRQPEFLIVDGGTGLEQALAALGAMCRPNAAPSTSIAICWPTRPRGCTTRSRSTTTT